ncbi:hypothetical protein K461DRAFT_272223 [Myriangium duriaei CBS 260.36]|uniref:Uncharacterized protein n=1 Tax=Myriangium duriaei CBS 260.36 TaxID=1168546 RepID=A0A9P4IWA5_9PEZI|nr:hypothetical protein K461DRAFT_272223 [Myriangium duriaei CBS 260.36]
MANRLSSELVGNVVENFAGDKEMLHKLLYVNKRWSANAQRFIWRSSTIEALSGIAPNDRQWYANQIKILTISSHIAVSELTAYNNIALPNLKTLILQSLDAVHASLTNFFLPTLEHVHLLVDNPGILTDNFLLSLPQRCPNLRELTVGVTERFEFDHSDIVNEALQGLLRAWPTLHSLILEDAMGYVISWDTLWLLLLKQGLNDLTDLRLSFHTFQHDAQAHRLGVPGLSDFLFGLQTCGQLRHVKTFSLSCTSGIAVELPRVFPELEDLRLRIVDSSTHFLAQLPALTKLEELHLSFPAGIYLDLTHLAPLHGLRALKILMIANLGEGGLMHLGPATDVEQSIFFSGFPNLEGITMAVSGTVGTTALIALGQSSPNLRLISLPGDYDFRWLQHLANPLLPNVRYLFVRKIHGTWQPISEVADLAPLIAKHIPNATLGCYPVTADPATRFLCGVYGTPERRHRLLQHA